ncbi:uncharacterized protein N7511_007135 [Penicillium nucicola]|uniref:uncharacterized protein n=1 Tax=Penicillium nucicola TaxID=1850975 RepID=UPI0025459B63|nr:uncharacterized protein N7511_007135 [Penicillium nucicola]KAJ5756953.1 hypothetical protein N7511_007135 [Penicillium nucicola]
MGFGFGSLRKRVEGSLAQKPHTTGPPSVASVNSQPSEDHTRATVPAPIQSDTSATLLSAQHSNESSQTTTIGPEGSVASPHLQDQSNISGSTSISTSVPVSQQPLTDAPQQSGCSEDSPKVLENGSDLWHRAYMMLQEQQTDLVKAYEEHLVSLQQDNQDTNGTSGERSVEHLVKQLLENREKKQWRVPLLKKEVKIREQVEKVARFAIWFDPVVQKAVSSQPYAALAWSGASLLLPLLTSGSTETEAMLKGFNSLNNVQLYWQISEDNYLKKKDLEHDKLEQKDVNYERLLEGLVKLYMLILEYQALVICHLSKRQWSRALNDMFKSTDWAAKIKDISEMSDTYSKLVDLHEAERISQIRDSELEELNHSRRILEDLRDLFESASKQTQVNKQDREERALLQDLAGPWGDHKDFNPKKVDGTCEWFFKDERFRSWRDAGTSTILWVSASPGCGKSVLSRALLDEQHLYRNVTSTVCYFFFKDGTESRMNATDALSAVLHQLFENDTEDELIKLALQSHRTNGHNLTKNLSELWKILMECVKSPFAGEIVILLDALDECRSESWKPLLDKLVDFYSELPSDQPSKLKFLITSRPYDDIDSKFKEFPKNSSYLGYDADDKSDEIGTDIDKVIDAKMMSNDNFVESERLLIAEKLKSMKQRTYLWLRLTFDLIQDRSSSVEQWADVEATLSDIPQEISGAYEKILNRSKNRRHAEALLLIMLAAQRPLTLTEANQALTLAVKLKECDSYTTLVSRSWHEATFQQKVKNLCGLFISVYDSKLFFIHQTAREFLIQRTQQGNWGGRLEMLNAHFEMTHICLRYLSCLGEDELKLIKCSKKMARRANSSFFVYNIRRHVEGDLGKKLPLVLYSARHWFEHARHSENEKDIQDSILNFLLPQGLPYLIWGKLFNPRCIWGEIPILNQKTSPLCSASFAGLSHIVRLLLQQNFHLNAEGLFADALQSACENGHVNVVHVLIENGADVKCSGEYALQAASIYGHIDLVRLLIDNGADIKRSAEFSLYSTSKSGHIDIVRLLIDNGADVKRWAESALYAASGSGHIDLVQLLIDNGADVKRSAEFSLYSTSKSGHIDIVRLLIDNGADVKRWAESALYAASGSGHIDLVQLLIDNGADVKRSAEFSLYSTSKSGHIDIVRLLIDNGADVKRWAESALYAASGSGHIDLVQLLIDNGADVKRWGGSALFAASRYGHIDIVQLLIDNGADVQAQNSYGGSAIEAAARSCHINTMKFLLENGADVNAREPAGLVPLASAGSKEALQFLLDHGAHVNSTNGRITDTNALLLASQRGQKNIVKLLLDNGADVNSRDGYQNAVFTAVTRDDIKSLQLLFNNGANFDLPNYLPDRELHFGGQHVYKNALEAASYLGHEEIVQLLLERGATWPENYSDTSARDSFEDDTSVDSEHS